MPNDLIDVAMDTPIDRLELGVGFAFLGSQYPLEVGGEDFYLDLLLDHLKLRAFVVIELKTTEFRPEYAGKMNLCFSTEASIGIILCKGKDRVMAEYALRDMGKPIGISGFRLAESLPESLRGSLPTIADLEAELAETERKERKEAASVEQVQNTERLRAEVLAIAEKIREHRRAIRGEISVRQPAAKCRACGQRGNCQQARWGESI